MWHFAADTGGTFTDCLAISPTGDRLRCKILSSSSLRTRVTACLPEGKVTIAEDWGMDSGFFAGFTVHSAGQYALVLDWHRESRTLTLSLEIPLEPGSILELTSHEEPPVLGARLLTRTPLGAAFPPMDFRVATTRATNALLEKKGSPTALFITQGFGDLLEIGDQRRLELFALQHPRRPLFHARSIEVPGRISAQGEELQPLDVDAIEAAASAALQQGIRHAAIALLHSYQHPQHEQALAAHLRRMGFHHVSLSSELAPFIKLLPRAQSAVANAYLTGPVETFLHGITQVTGQDSRVQVMTSAAGLEPVSQIRPKDMLLSGPAGGALGAAAAAADLGFPKVLTFDMGGTSTDVARIENHRPDYRFTQDVAGMSLLAPCVSIETVAAGGGSICSWTASGLKVGPESAGSRPGPACYGAGGPLTITDVNLLCARFDPSRAPLPLDRAAAEARLEELLDSMAADLGQRPSPTETLRNLLDIATEQMADAIRRISLNVGFAPTDYALLAFGGAGPQHACAVADRLGMSTIIVPENAGLLSASGLLEAVREKFVEKQILAPLDEVGAQIPALIEALTQEGRAALESPSSDAHFMAELRLLGQDTALQVPVTTPENLAHDFAAAHVRLFGYAPPASRKVELVSLRGTLRELKTRSRPASIPAKVHPATDTASLVQDAFSTLVVEPHWQRTVHPGLGTILRKANTVSATSPTGSELMRHRFHTLVGDMGALLRRTAISTNIRERLDFSCALLDAEGRLIASAPHIPVHLGALGVCVRLSLAAYGAPLADGDTLITNHPGYGGSHLPDVTLITAVRDDAGQLLGYVANRAHHAEIGGKAPGSMPADATCLAQEGVVIPPTALVTAGVLHWQIIEQLFTSGPYPTRNLGDNLADLHAQLAANRLGTERLKSLGSAKTLAESMSRIFQHSATVMRARLAQLQPCQATQQLDDGSTISVSFKPQAQRLQLDFTGTSPTHPGNLNATLAIVSSAVLYVLRVLLQEDFPLNEGLLDAVDLQLPPGTLLSPKFTGDPQRDPAVVGGNVEVSQRLVDTLFLALQLQACSQGTMNNLLFGSPTFGYYETIAGGAGAGPGYPGASALQTHMTNTAITDPEILERRYPVRLQQFAIRRGSGGKGLHFGGDGVIRQIQFLAPLTLTLLTQHRQSAPYGLAGGNDGQPGHQTLTPAQGQPQALPSSCTLPVQPGDLLTLHSPGGGGWGTLG